MRGMVPKYFVGQEGDFETLDSFGNPREKLAGRILQLTDSRDALYATIDDGRQTVSVRLG